MSVEAGHARVPIEFIGRARLLRNEVIAEGDRLNDGLMAATAQIRRRVLKQPSIRREHLVELRRAWTERVPHRFRLADQFEGDHKAFVLAMYQLRGATWSAANWEEREPGLLISLVALSWDGRTFEQQVIDLARWSAYTRLRGAISAASTMMNMTC